MKFLLISWFGLFWSLTTAQYVGDECRMKHNGASGICTVGRECRAAIELQKQQGVRVTVCAFLSGQAIVCCPTTNSRPQTPQAHTSSSQRISAKKCEEYKKLYVEIKRFNGLSLGPSQPVSLSEEDCMFSNGLIVGGEKATQAEFPHMVALMRQTIEGAKAFCGGTLISELFVLTAGHCKLSSEFSVFARIGSLRIQNAVDGVKEFDIPVSDFIRHERYNRLTKENDIGLAKLSRKVPFSKSIRPACLWQVPTIPESKVIATGWGFTEYGGTGSDDLLKVHLDIIGLEKCKETYEDDDNVVDGRQICAGVLVGGRDTCQGDSGGPIQIKQNDNKCISHVVGITSYGSICGSKNAPSVYTRVSGFVDWIEEKVWPDSV